ncbi:hypothetical protein [Pseudarthrobacter sp. DSP2-3-2b1]|uniref:hypothetical protein n=1 Tax=Pseudarthrobacter sp. DSP2-3-2b1 TaxID=2804661 RepID=UPI003CF1AA36
MAASVEGWRNSSQTVMFMVDRSFVTGSASAEHAAVAFKALRLPSHLTLECLVQVVEGFRNCRIEIEVSGALNGGSVCGLWLSTATTEIILHAATPSVLHRQQFVLHELGHMVLRHDELVLPADYASVLFPNLPGELVSRVLSRSSFVDHIEAAAETLADLFASAIRDSAIEPRSFEKIFG